MTTPKTLPTPPDTYAAHFTPNERADDAIWRVDALVFERHMNMAMDAGNYDEAERQRLQAYAATSKRLALRRAVACRVKS